MGYIAMHGNPAEARESLGFPFDSGQTWKVLRGYNCTIANGSNCDTHGPPTATDVGYNQYAFDLQRDCGSVCSVDANVRATFGGTVTWSSDFLAAGVYGCAVVIKGDDNARMAFIHLNYSTGTQCGTVAVNQTVTKGQVIGTVKGGANLNHLHIQWCTQGLVPSQACGTTSNDPMDRKPLNEGAFCFPTPGPFTVGKGEWYGQTLTETTCGSPPPPPPLTWHFWEQLGGGFTFASDPAVASWAPGRLDVFVRGGDNRLYHGWLDGGGWHFFEQLAGDFFMVGNPAAASWGSDRIDVFMRGGDSKLYHGWYDTNGWHFWEQLGGGFTFASDPAVASWAPGRLDVFVRGGDNRLYHGWLDGGGWHFFEQLAGDSSMPGNPAVVSWGSNQLDVFVRGYDNGLWHGCGGECSGTYVPQLPPSPNPTFTPTDTATLTPTATSTPGSSVSVGGIAEPIDTATLPSADTAGSRGHRLSYGFVGSIAVLVVIAAGGAFARRRRR
jgi:hypothetical protein